MPDEATDRTATRQMVVRRARMAFIFTVVGLLWVSVSLVYTQRLTPASLSVAGMAAATSLVACLALLRRAPRFPDATLTRTQAARLRRILVAVNILEWVAVATAFAVLMLVHLPEYIPTAAGIIVGVYLFPVAGALRAPLHTVTATLLLGWNVVALALFSRSRQASLGAAGTGAILLASATLTLGWAFWRTRTTTVIASPSVADLLIP